MPFHERAVELLREVNQPGPADTIESNALLMERVLDRCDVETAVRALCTLDAEASSTAEGAEGLRQKLSEFGGASGTVGDAQRSFAELGRVLREMREEAFAEFTGKLRRQCAIGPLVESRNGA